MNDRIIPTELKVLCSIPEVQRKQINCARLVRGTLESTQSKLVKTQRRTTLLSVVQRLQK